LAWGRRCAGAPLLVQAERDGDTVSPAQGVYLVDRTTTVTVQALAARIAAQFRAERALRAEAEAMFAPLDAAVRRLVGRVSKDRLYRTQADLYAFDSKFVGTPGNAQAAAYLMDRLRQYGYEPVLQEFEIRPGLRSANVVARKRGSRSPDLHYVAGAHFDSVRDGPGAEDNTTGTAMLLETARVFADVDVPATVTFVFFTGEEAGLLGSREFVRRLQEEGARVVGVLNTDTIGWSGDQRLDNTIRYSNPGIRDVQHGAAIRYSRLVTYDAVYYKNTDAASFHDAYGDIVGGFGSYPVLGSPHYHQPHDVLETINHELVAETTKAHVATLAYLVQAPSRVPGVRATRLRDVVTVRWEAAPEPDVREYVARWRAADGTVGETQTTTARVIDFRGVPADATVEVRAVDGRGLAGWDWGRAVAR
jgi:hypothetical protein